MRITETSIRFRMLCGALACCMAAPALGQQGNQNDRQRNQEVNQQDRDQRERERAQQDRERAQQDRERQQQRAEQERERQRQQAQQQRERAQQDRERGQQDRERAQQQRDRERQQARVRIAPEGWVQMAIDYDRDGRFDALETIYVYDLQMARQRSQERRTGDRWQVGRQSLERSAMERGRRAARPHRVQGQLTDVRRIQMHDGDGRYVIGRVRTEQGRTAKVLLGREDQLSQLDLQEGKRVQLEGRVGRINEQPVLVATRVGAGDQQVRVQPKRMARPVRQVKGEVLQTRTANFRGHDESFVLAEIRTDEGRRQTVNLGPKSKLGDVNWQQADQVRLLAAPGRVNGQPALIAEQISVNDRTIKIAPDERRDRRWRNQQSRGDDRNRQNR